jgi:hypothetical protein
MIHDLENKNIIVSAHSLALETTGASIVVSSSATVFVNTTATIFYAYTPTVAQNSFESGA